MLYTWSTRGDLEAHDHYFSSTAVNTAFTYNGVGQMETRTLSDPSYGWAAPTTGTSVYAVNGLNQYTDIDGVAPVHDTNGNLETDPQGRSFSYDAENVLRSVTGLTGGTASYRYHADGSRREKSHNGATSTHYYMGGLGYLDAGDSAFAADQEIAEYAGGTLLKRFIRLPGSIDKAFLMIDVSGGTPTETWAHTDRLGSVIATTDATGTVQDKYRYSPYGKPGSEGAGGFPFRFTGQRLDAETGLYYYKARYYAPETGRFLQTDPIGYDDQMNLYAYVGNDPVNGKDPLGLCITRTGSRLCVRTEHINKAVDPGRSADAERIFADGRPLTKKPRWRKENGDVVYDEYIVHGTPNWEDDGEPYTRKEWEEKGILGFPGKAGLVPDTGARVDQRVDALFQQQVLAGHVVIVTKVGANLWSGEEMYRTQPFFMRFGQFDNRAYRTILLKREWNIGIRSAFELLGLLICGEIRSDFVEKMHRRLTHATCLIFVSRQELVAICQGQDSLQHPGQYWLQINMPSSARFQLAPTVSLLT